MWCPSAGCASQHYCASQGAMAPEHHIVTWLLVTDPPLGSIQACLAVDSSQLFENCWAAPAIATAQSWPIPGRCNCRLVLV
jgi:hypothetical protein